MLQQTKPRLTRYEVAMLVLAIIGAVGAIVYLVVLLLGAIGVVHFAA